MAAARTYLSLVVIAFLSMGTLTSPAHATERKRLCKIGIASLNDFLSPDSRCNTSESVVSLDGILRLRADDAVREDHSYSQHSAPFWLAKAIRESDVYTPHLSRADAVFVNDYCFLAKYIAQLQANSIEKEAIAAWRDGYKLLMETQSFRMYNGSNFGIFSPFPPTGPPDIVDMICSQFRRSLHISAEAAQQYVCEEPVARHNQLLVPYLSAKFVEDNGEWPERNTFIYFQGNCGFRDNTHGTFMRNSFVEALKQLELPNVTAYCNSERMVTPCMVAHDVLRQELKQSVFCPIIPGDTASSRRLTEVILAGCVPVFLGPPWHTMPLTQELRYEKFALFFAVKSLAHLGKHAFPDSAAALNESKASSIFDPWWWVSDTDMQAHTVHFLEIKDVVHHLKSLPKHILLQLQNEVLKVESHFRYRRKNNTKREKTAADIIIHHLCKIGTIQ